MMKRIKELQGMKIESGTGNIFCVKCVQNTRARICKTYNENLFHGEQKQVFDLRYFEHFRNLFQVE